MDLEAVTESMTRISKAIRDATGFSLVGSTAVAIHHAVGGDAPVFAAGDLRLEMDEATGTIALFTESLFAWITLDRALHADSTGDTGPVKIEVHARSALQTLHVVTPGSFGIRLDASFVSPKRGTTVRVKYAGHPEFVDLGSPEPVAWARFYPSLLADLNRA